MKDNAHLPESTSRRQFLKTTSTAIIGGSLAAHLGFSGKVFGANSDPLRLGLIGCGGRGTGAANEALNADENVSLVAMGDIFASQLKNSMRNLKASQKVGDRVKVDEDHCFVGLDAYQKVINSGVDVVILATPPGFRPTHLKAAVEAGKHVFCEKPMATDVPGLRSVLESARMAKEKNLNLVAGFCWRRDFARREFYKRLHDGAIGDVRAVYATYLTQPVKPMPPASSRGPSVGDVEWQLRNWYNFVWLSGDGLVEQACHSIDKIAWAMNGVLPIKAVGNGGRQIPNNQGNIYDHIDVFYEFPNGVRAFMAQRQTPNCHSDNSDYILGATGTGTIKGWNAPVLAGKEKWVYSGPKNNMYQTEHDELFAAIRKGETINDGEWMCNSTLMALMGRDAAYTGQEITWEEISNSQEKLVPDPLTWDMSLPLPPMATPGVTRFA